MRLTPIQQLVLIRDFLRKLKDGGQVADAEVQSLLELPLIGGATQLEHQLEHLKYWQDWRKELQG